MNGISTVDCLSYLTGHSSEYVFYRTDHHWTSLGAYYAYCAAAKTLGYSAYALDQFNIETASSSFRGTLYSKTLDNGVTPDSIDYFHLASGGPKVKMTVFDGAKETVYDSLYVRSYLDVKDKYSSFTGSNSPIVTMPLRASRCPGDTASTRQSVSRIRYFRLGSLIFPSTMAKSSS